MGPVSAKPQESLNTLDRVSKMDIHVNGIKYTVVDPDPVMMLSEWLRMHLNLKGKSDTKLSVIFCHHLIIHECFTAQSP